MTVSATLGRWTGHVRHGTSRGYGTGAPEAIATALAALIFVIDTFTQLRIAAAVLYVVVVLLSANFCARRGIFLWGSACAGLTIGSFLITRASTFTENDVGRTLVSILAIATTTFLAMRNRSASDALRRTEAYLTDAQRLSRTGSFAFNPARRQVAWSEETYRIFEYDRTQTPTQELARARIHPDDLGAWTAFLDRRANRENVDERFRLLFQGGRVKHIRALAHPAENPDGELEFIGALMDRTEARNAENELLETQAALARVTRATTLGELMASIAHEVNQPLGAIVTNGEASLRWLGRVPPNLEEAKSAVGRMISDGRRASEVIGRLRALSSKDGLHKTSLNLNEIVREAIPLVQRELFNHRIVLKLDLDPSLPAVPGDKVQLQQVVINLIVNAAQALSHASARPRNISVRSERHEGGGVRVVVRDNGPGIAPENLDRLFIAFFTTKDQGMGMGLSICRSIVEAHGGRIWGANNDGPGATFGFILQQQEAGE